MDKIVIIGCLAAVFALILWASWYFSDAEITKRALRAAPRKKIGEVTEGELVKIVGRLELYAEPIIAPLSGRSCAYFETVVEEKTGGKNKSWRPRIRETDVREFVIADKTGKALVEVGNIRIVAVQDHHQTSGFLEDATPRLEAYLARHGYSSTSFLGTNHPMRYREAVLEAGEEVAVLGRARWELDPHSNASGAGGYRGGAKRLVIEAPETEGPLLASDDPSTLA